MKKTLLGWGSLIAIALTMVGAFGQSVAAGPVMISSDNGSTTIEKSRTVDGSAYIAGNVVSVMGTVNGDLYCAGNTVQIEGTVNGDVLCAGATVEVKGVVNGDVRLAGSSILLSGQVNGNASVAASDVIANAEFKLKGDLTGGASNVTLRGTVGRDMMLGSEHFMLEGTVGRDVNASISSVEFGNDAKVGGDFNYQNNKELAIKDDAVAGKVNYNTTSHGGDKSALAMGLLSAVIYAFGIGLLAFIGALIAPRAVRAVSNVSIGMAALAALIGFAAIFLLPILALLAMLTGVGIPVGYALMVAWLLLMAVSPVFFAYFIGEKLWGNRSRNVLMHTTVGAALLIVLLLIPAINVVTFVVMLLVGVGLPLLWWPRSLRNSPYEVTASEVVKKPVKKVAKKI